MAEGYRVLILPSALRQLEQLTVEVRSRVVAAIDGLAREPRPPGSQLLRGSPDVRIHRIRVGDHRVVYQIEDDRLVVLVVRVADRSDAYNQMVLKRLRTRLRRRS